VLSVLLLLFLLAIVLSVLLLLFLLAIVLSVLLLLFLLAIQHNGQKKKEKQRSIKQNTNNYKSSNTNPNGNKVWPGSAPFVKVKYPFSFRPDGRYRNCQEHLKLNVESRYLGCVGVYRIVHQL
jgi:predicted membrane protein